jgi:hypothetical protein
MESVSSEFYLVCSQHHHVWCDLLMPGNVGGAVWCVLCVYCIELDHMTACCLISCLPLFVHMYMNTLCHINIELKCLFQFFSIDQPESLTVVSIYFNNSKSSKSMVFICFSRVMMRKKMRRMFQLCLIMLLPLSGYFLKSRHFIISCMLTTQ